MMPRLGSSITRNSTAVLRARAKARLRRLPSCYSDMTLTKLKDINPTISGFYHLRKRLRLKEKRPRRSLEGRESE